MDFIQRLVHYFAVIRRQMRRHRRAVLTCAAVVVFATTYALVLPAITLDKDEAEQQPGISLEQPATEEGTDGTAAEATATEDAAAEEQSQAEETIVAEPATATASDASSQPAASELTSRGDDYSVQVSYDETAGIPAGAELQVSEIPQGSDEYNSYLQQAKDAMGDGSDVAAARFFDVSLVADGNKVEPATPVKIDITYDQALSADAADDIKQVHFADSGTEVLDVDATRDGDGNVTQVSLEQSSLSVTGTVVSNASGTNWPASGSYVMIIKGSDDNWYAVESVQQGTADDDDSKSVGSLYKVDYDSSTGVVTFPTIASTSDLTDYTWTVTSSSGYHYIYNGNNYVDPTESDGIYTSSSYSYNVYRNDSNQLYGYYYGYSYLTTDENNSTIVGSSDSSDAREVLFVSNFSATRESGGEDPDTPSVDLGAPTTSKSLSSNNDGTYDLTLSVEGKSQAQTTRTTADILVVIDTSGSMSSTDMETEKTAITTLANSLFANNTSDNGGDLVHMAYMTFDTVAYTPSGWYSSASQFNSAINNISDDNKSYQLTNWDNALDVANTKMGTARTDAKKYVIFISDGNPTCSSTSRFNGDRALNQTGSDGLKHAVYRQRQSQDYSLDSSTNVQYSYQTARSRARAIVQGGSDFYGVAVQFDPDDDVSRMGNLVAYAYTEDDSDTYPNGHLQNASNAQTLASAFQGIVNEINSNFQFTNVKLTDGITALTSKVSIDGTAGAFTYSATNSDGTTHKVEDWAKTATYDSGTGMVTWDLGKNKLPDGVTYKCTFTVWPTQQAYDTVAALENGTITYGDTSATVDGNTVDWTYFVRNSDGSYSYRTNTSQQVSYKQVSTVNGTETTSDEKTSDIPANPLPAMPLDKGQVSVQKTFDFGGTSADSTMTDNLTYQLNLTQDGTDHISLTLRGSQGNETTKSGSAWVAPGLIRTGSNGSYEVLETGHDYTFAESGDDAGKWTLETDTYHPMVIGTELVMLRKEGTAEPTSGTYYKIGDNYYSVIDNSNATITATNTLKTYDVIIKKTDNGNPANNLGGVTFRLTKQNGESWEAFSVKDVTSTEEGHLGEFTIADASKDSGVTLTGLPNGTYKLTETKAPSGYVISTSDVTFTITNGTVTIDKKDGKNSNADVSSSKDGTQPQTITIKNTPGQALPETGGSGTLPYALAGSALVTTAIVGFALRRKNEGRDGRI